MDKTSVTGKKQKDKPQKKPVLKELLLCSNLSHWGLRFYWKNLFFFFIMNRDTGIEGFGPQMFYVIAVKQQGKQLTTFRVYYYF